MIDLIFAILTGGLAAFLALFVVSFLFLGLISGFVHLFVKVMNVLQYDLATVHQKQMV